MDYKQLPQPARDDIQLDHVLAALADPHRRHVVVSLAREADGTQRSCSSFGLPLSKSTRTHHFRVLREAGLLEQRDAGNAKLNILRRSDIDLRFPGLLATIISCENQALRDPA